MSIGPKNVWQVDRLYGHAFEIASLSDYYGMSRAAAEQASESCKRGVPCQTVRLLCRHILLAPKTVFDSIFDCSVCDLNEKLKNSKAEKKTLELSLKERRRRVSLSFFNWILERSPSLCIHLHFGSVLINILTFVFQLEWKLSSCTLQPNISQIEWILVRLGPNFVRQRGIETDQHVYE